MSLSLPSCKLYPDIAVLATAWVRQASKESLAGPQQGFSNCKHVIGSWAYYPVNTTPAYGRITRRIVSHHTHRVVGSDMPCGILRAPNLKPRFNSDAQEACSSLSFIAAPPWTVVGFSLCTGSLSLPVSGWCIEWYTAALLLAKILPLCHAACVRPS